jgi:hypothetical protein
MLTHHHPLPHTVRNPTTFELTTHHGELLELCGSKMLGGQPGIRAKQWIPKGTLVGYYVGKLVTPEQSEVLEQVCLSTATCWALVGFTRPEARLVCVCVCVCVCVRAHRLTARRACQSACSQHSLVSSTPPPRAAPWR